MAAKKILRRIDCRYMKGRLFLIWHGVSFNKYREIIGMSRNPTLIGGCGRSGTTLLLSLLSAHPNIYAFQRETKAFTPGTYPMTGTVDTKGDFRIDVLYETLIEEDTDQFDRWCEKTPMNVHFYDRLVDYFRSEMRFLNIVRDGRNVVTSRHPDDPSSYWVVPSRWVRDVQAGREIEEDDQCLTVKYEELIQDHTQSLSEICDFLGVQYTSAFENYPESAAITSNSAWFGKAKSVRDTSKARWKKEEHKEVVEELLEIPGAVDHLRHYNYL